MFSDPMTAAQYYELERCLSAADETFDDHFTNHSTPDGEIRDSIRRLLMVVAMRRIRSEQSENVRVEEYGLRDRRPIAPEFSGV